MERVTGSPSGAESVKSGAGSPRERVSLGRPSIGLLLRSLPSGSKASGIVFQIPETLSQKISGQIGARVRSPPSDGQERARILPRLAELVQALTKPSVRRVDDRDA